MPPRFDVSFRVGVAAWCRDCGEPVDEARLRCPDGPVEMAPSDRGCTVAYATKAGACEACGGGRVAVRVDVGLGEPTRE